MERIKNKIFRRTSASTTITEDMDTSTPPTPTPNGVREDPSASYMSIVPHGVSPSPSELDLQVQQLSEENARLKSSVDSLTTELETLKATQLGLLSTVDDLNHTLQLHKQRLTWQKEFYEGKMSQIQQNGGVDGASEGVSSSKMCQMAQNGGAMGKFVVNGSGGISYEGLEGISTVSPSKEFLHSTILSLVEEQERKNLELESLRSEFSLEIQLLREVHEAKVAEISQKNEELISDLLTGCQGLFDDMKTEFLQQQQIVGNEQLNEKSGRTLWAQFQGFSTEKKGVIVVGVCIITVATAGWASWGFIIWVWPRLLLFAESIAANPEALAQWVSFLVAFLNSSQFQSFIRMWEEGQPLPSCLKAFVNTQLLSNALLMAPNLFRQLRCSKNRQPLPSTPTKH